MPTSILPSLLPSTRFILEVGVYVCVYICMYFLFVKVNARDANRAQVTAPISTVSSCSWSSLNFMKWKIAHPGGTLNHDHLISCPEYSTQWARLYTHQKNFSTLHQLNNEKQAFIGMVVAS